MVLSCPFLSLRILKIAVPSCLRQGLALLTWSFSKMSRLEEGSRGGRCDTWEKHGKPMKKNDILWYIIADIAVEYGH